MLIISLLIFLKECTGSSQADDRMVLDHGIYTVCPRSSDPLLCSNLLHKMGHYFLDRRYQMLIQKWVHSQGVFLLFDLFKALRKRICSPKRRIFLRACGTCSELIFIIDTRISGVAIFFTYICISGTSLVKMGHNNMCSSCYHFLIA